MTQPTLPQRPRVTLRILFFALFDIAGMALFAAGVFWFAQHTPLLFANYPTDMPNAILCVVIGLGGMLWSAAKILGEILKQANRS